MSSFLRALADNYITMRQRYQMPLRSSPPSQPITRVSRSGGCECVTVEAIGTDNGAVTMYARDDWRVLPDYYTTDPHKVHTKPEGYSGWGRVEEWHRCMREIMTAARASMRYTEADGWPEVQP